MTATGGRRLRAATVAAAPLRIHPYEGRNINVRI
jgi:hypothetical protein